MPDSQPGPPGRSQHEVLITRPAEAARRTAIRVGRLGFTPVLAPLFAVQPCSVRWPDRFAAVLLTSGHAVPALCGLAGVPVLTVGDGTAERARDAGVPTVESARGDAAALLDLARRRLAPGTAIVLATGAGQGAALAAGLRTAGFRVHRRVAYRTRPVRRLPDTALAAIRGGNLHAALFLSADTARIFRRLLPRNLYPALATTDAAVIAPGVADALAPLPWRQVRVSVEPTLDQVLALL